MPTNVRCALHISLSIVLISGGILMISFESIFTQIPHAQYLSDYASLPRSRCLVLNDTLPFSEGGSSDSSSSSSSSSSVDPLLSGGVQNFETRVRVREEEVLSDLSDGMDTDTDTPDRIIWMRTSSAIASPSFSRIWRVGDSFQCYLHPERGLSGAGLSKASYYVFESWFMISGFLAGCAIGEVVLILALLQACSTLNQRLDQSCYWFQEILLFAGVAMIVCPQLLSISYQAASLHWTRNRLEVSENWLLHHPCNVTKSYCSPLVNSYQLQYSVDQNVVLAEMSIPKSRYENQCLLRGDSVRCVSDPTDATRVFLQPPSVYFDVVDWNHARTMMFFGALLALCLFCLGVTLVFVWRIAYG